MRKFTVTEARREIASEYCQDVGLDATRARKCVDAVADLFELDLQTFARNTGLRYLGLEETYALISIFRENS